MVVAASRARSERVVVYRLGSLGDTVVALPCLHAIGRKFPDAERVMLTNIPVGSKAAPLEQILGGSGLVHGYMAYPLGTRSFRELWALRRSLLDFGARTLVYLTPARGRLAAWRDVMFFRLCGFTSIIGAPTTTDLQSHRLGKDGLLERESERLARCLRKAAPLALDDPEAWSLRLTSAERAAGVEALGSAVDRPRIAINMGGKVVKNDWGEANWRALILQLRDRCAGHALVCVGSAEDSARATRIGEAWGAMSVNLCGKVSPRISAAAIAGSDVFIGHDSGPLHLAAAMGVPCVGLYGDHYPPRIWHPYGDQHRIIHDMRGVLAIAVDDVAGAALGIIPAGKKNSDSATPASLDAPARR